ncbi:MAG: tRNA (adenosine(37)-N6)-threonylcarbamoyltransferase complex dimerization subunit type 1 TsaB [Gemmatimonadota bacterium]
MSVVLALDASTYHGTVALLDQDRILASGEVQMRGETEKLMPAVVALLKGAGLVQSELSAVICGAGPGAFTPVRIAASIAKGVVLGLGIPLYSVGSLALLAAEAPEEAGGRLLVALDAMRGEYYCSLAVRDDTGEVLSLEPVTRVPADQVAAHAAAVVAVAVSPDFPAEYPVRPHARGVRHCRRLVAEVALDGWEPDYGRLAEAQVRLEATRAASERP